MISTYTEFLVRTTSHLAPLDAFICHDERAIVKCLAGSSRLEVNSGEGGLPVSSKSVGSVKFFFDFAWKVWTNVENWAVDADLESVELMGGFCSLLRAQCFGAGGWLCC